MGRSSKEQAEQNRVNIVEAASRLIRAHGAREVGIADMMAAAGMTQGGFYKHFASKDALAALACERAFDHAEQGWDAVLARPHRGRTTSLKEVVAYYLTPKPPEKTCPMVALNADAVAAAASSEPALRAAYTEGVGRLASYVVEHAGDEASEERALLVFAAMVGAAMLGRAIDDGRLAGKLRATVLKAAAAEA